MKVLLHLAAALLLIQQGRTALFKNLYKDTGKLWSSPLNDDVGSPLILTPYRKEGRIQEVQQAALVKDPQFLDVVSYAGYFTVDERFNSNIWFWYFPSADNVSVDPVVLWLNGGPGASSLNGLFDENGPFLVDDNGTVSLREYSWHRNHSVIFVDNPVGVGFSFTNGGLAENETKVGEDMFSALTQFFQLFPDLQKNPFYISGESYAGKYLPAIGYTILKKNPTAELKLNLQGILIGDGWTDPVNQLNYGPFAYNTGLVSADVRKLIDGQRDDAIRKVKEGDYLAASDHWGSITTLIEIHSRVNIYNYVENYDDANQWPTFITTPEIRRALHVGDIPYGDKGAGDALQPELLKSIAPWVEELLENYRVLIYTGQVDIICGYPMVLDYVSNLNFTGAEALAESPRGLWYTDDGDLAGYVRTGGNLVELLVKDAGHMVPRDQPKSAYDMLYKFTRNQPYA